MRRIAACVLALAACSSPAEAPPTSIATPAPASAAPAATTTPPPTTAAPAWPAEASTARVGGGCTASSPIAIAAAPSSVALAATPSGALLAYSQGEHVVTQRLDPGGHPTGDPGGLDVPHLGALIGMARLGDGLVLVAAAGCTEGGWRHVCLVAAPLDATGHATGAQASRELTFDTLDAAPSWDRLAARGPLLVSSATAGAVWVVSAFDTSHDGNGINVERVSLGPGGAAEVGARHAFVDGLPDGAQLTGFRVSATDDELVVLFGSRSDLEEPPMSARYLGRFSDDTTTQLGDLGDVVHDVVLEGGQVHVLSHRAESYLASVVDPAGRLGEPTEIDRSQPLPAPFGTRVLVEMAGPADHQARVLHDASGRRLGDPIPEGPLAWTSTSLLVASGTGATSITPLTCRAP